MLSIILKSLQQHSTHEPINEPINEPISLILSLLKENPSYTKEELAEKIGKSRATVTRILSKLVDEGKIKRVGSNKTGHWEILSP
jgi:predicted HTH transcriptional regulator